MHDFIQTVDLSDAANVRKTAEGFLVAEPRVARTGVQIYRGFELGRPDLATVRVMRHAEAVFSEDAMKSYTHKTITSGHKGMIDAKNWKKYAVGHSGDTAIRDGDYVRVPMMITDQEVIDAYERGEVKEISLGYKADVNFNDSGSDYDASMTGINTNHIAIVPNARGGESLRIGDEQGGKKMTGMTLNGISIEVADAATAQAIQTYVKDLMDQLTTANAKVTDLTKQVTDAATAASTKDAEIVTLKTQLADSAITPEKMATLVKDKQILDAAAKQLIPDTDVSKMTGPQIKKAIVNAKLGDMAKDWTDDQIDVSYKSLSAGIQVGDQAPVSDERPSSIFGSLFDSVYTKRQGQQPFGVNDEEKQILKDIEDQEKFLNDSWKGVTQ